MPFIATEDEDHVAVDISDDEQPPPQRRPSSQRQAPASEAMKTVLARNGGRARLPGTARPRRSLGDAQEVR